MWFPAQTLTANSEQEQKNEIEAMALDALVLEFGFIHVFLYRRSVFIRSLVGRSIQHCNKIVSFRCHSMEMKFAVLIRGARI